jgi:hypothetical protein
MDHQVRPLTTLLASAIIVASLAFLAACSDSNPKPTPTPDGPHYGAETVKGLVAETLGPYPAYRPAEGQCYAIITRPFVLRAPAVTPPGEDLRGSAAVAYSGNGKWLVKWRDGEWQVDDRDGAVAPLNSRAVNLLDTSRLPCPDLPAN